MVGSHEGEPCRLFDQAIYTYLISCRVGSGFRVGLSGPTSQPDPTLFQKNSNPTRRGQSMQKEIAMTRLNPSSENILNEYLNSVIDGQVLLKLPLHGEEVNLQAN